MSTDYARMTDDFENYDVDAGSFSHEHHVGVAFEILSRHDFLTAAYRYSDIINTVATRAGAGDKFNTTITIAFLSIIAERMNGREFDGAQDFIANNQDLLTQNPLAPLYSRERIMSAEARSTFLLPDLKPLPAA